MKKRKWYYTGARSGENIDIEGEPDFHLISDTYDGSCVHEEDADLYCPSCVIDYLQNVILEKEREICEMKEKNG